MEPKGSLLHSQEPKSGPYFEPDAFNDTFLPYFLNIHSNIIFSSMPMSSE